MAKRAQAEPGEAILEGSSEVTLLDLIDNLGRDFVSVVAAPQGLDVVATHVTIHDPAQDSPIGSGDIVLGVGTEASRPDVLNLIEEAGRSRAAAVIVRARENAPDIVVKAAESANVGVLAVATDISWGQLHTMVRTVISAPGEALETSAGGVPAGDLFALANAVAALVGGPVTIEDQAWRVLAYSNTDDPIDEARRQAILGRKVPERWTAWYREQGILRRLWAGEVVRIEFPDDTDATRPRLAAAVRAGGDVIGSIWVLEGSEPFGLDAEEALREAARIAALHLIRHRSGEDLERRRRSDLLASVLDGQLPGHVVTSELAFTDALAVVAFDLGAGEHQDAVMKADQAVDAILMFCQAFRQPAAAVAIDEVAYLLVSVEPGQVPDDLSSVLTRMVDRLRPIIGGEITAAVSSVVADPAALPEARWEADHVLSVMLERGEKGIGYLDQVASGVVMTQLREAALKDQRLLRGKLGALAAHDRDKGTTYIATLRAYLDAFGDLPKASESLFVHPNTFRYRLKRLMELGGLDLGDPEERIIIHLQLHLMDRQPVREE